MATNRDSLSGTVRPVFRVSLLCHEHSGKSHACIPPVSRPPSTTSPAIHREEVEETVERRVPRREDAWGCEQQSWCFVASHCGSAYEGTRRVGERVREEVDEVDA